MEDWLKRERVTVEGRFLEVANLFQLISVSISLTQSKYHSFALVVPVYILSFLSNLSCPCPLCSTYTDLCFIYMIPTQFLEHVKKFSYLRIFAYAVRYPGTFFLWALCLIGFFSNSKTQFICHFIWDSLPGCSV